MLLADVAASQANLTQAGLTLGTPRYMSPEQVQGKSVDVRSDLYSLGVTMYHLLAGRPPFEADDPLALALMHLHETPMPPKLKTTSSRANVLESTSVIICGSSDKYMDHEMDRPRARTISIAFAKCRSWRFPERISSPMISRPIFNGSDFIAGKFVCRNTRRQAAHSGCSRRDRMSTQLPSEQNELQA